MSEEKTIFQDTIPLEEGIALTAGYRDFIAPLVPSIEYIRAFYIPIDDITQLAQFHKSPAVRAYLCLTDPNDPSTMKIVLVPIDSLGNDILSVPSPDSGEPMSTIYDFTKPCPTACDLNSPLFQLIQYKGDAV